MIDLIGAIVGLATQVLQFVESKQTTDLVNQLKQAELDLNAEKAKGYGADDAKIEALHGTISVLIGSVQNELNLYAASKSGASPVATAATVAADVVGAGHAL